MSEEDAVPPTSGIVLYRTSNGRTRVECRFEGGTIWLSQLLLAELYQRDVRTINEHLQNIYDEAELGRESTIRKFRIVRSEGSREVSREVEYYNLEVILAVGYRVRGPRGTQFRQWATSQLEELLRKGFVMDDERLRNLPSADVPDYFDELLDRIRDIRASERRMYLRIREMFSLAADYASNDDETKRVFQIVQNKLHFTVTGLTAPELIAARADATHLNMGLTSWAKENIRKSDVVVAKNYLLEPEIAELNRIVVMFLDYAEDQARRRQQVFLRDWKTKLDEFLRFNERTVLSDGGSVSRDLADQIAIDAYEQFAARRRSESENRGEIDAIETLEAVAKMLPKRKEKGTADGDQL